MAITLPKDALKQVQLGQSFAEYDFVRNDPTIFVQTPASIAATDTLSTKFIFIGRRGSGKTAIAYHISRTNRHSIRIEPLVFDLIKLPLQEDDFRDTRQRPFKSLVCAFERALLGEVVRSWIIAHAWKFEDAPEALRKERGLIEDCDFDLRVLNLHEEIHTAFKGPSDKMWLRQISRASKLVEEINAIRTHSGFDCAITIDRLDDAWNGSESAVICLMALMHACVRLAAACSCFRPFIFVRENIYRRIREIDNEFARLETAIVFLEWTPEKLIELVSRRLVRRLSTKPSIEDAWPYFFEDSSIVSKQHFVEHSQFRPRHILTHVNFAIEVAVSKGHRKVLSEDLASATERFSTSKLKDLADEFDENYHNIQLVLQLFYGLSTDYTIRAIENFIQRLLVDPRIAQHCDWLVDNSTPHSFIGVLYQIGFFGVKDTTKWKFAGIDGQSADAPQLTQNSTIRIHPAFHAALHLRELLLTEISDELILQSTGILEELPTGVSFDDFYKRLQELHTDISTLPTGQHPAAGQFEEFVGDFVRLCFFRALSNIQPKQGDVGRIVIRDWIASNRAKDGFWQLMLTKYGASQVIFECKNYTELSASDFHQAAYYLKHTAKLVIIVFRGEELKTNYFDHIRRAVEGTSGMILLFHEKDIKAFLRQAINGKVKEDHVNEIHDRIERSIG